MSLEVVGVSVALGGRRVLEDVSLSVPSGHLVGLLGANGCGKSTLLRTLYRVHRPVAGHVRIDDQDLLALPPRLAARRVSAVGQNESVDVDVTVRELVALGRTPHQRRFARDSSADRTTVGDALSRTGLVALADRSLHTLSGGELQRALIARALAQEADHLLLDEPTNHLDIRYQLELLELVRRLGLTVLAALHDLNLAALFCDRIYLLADGRVLAGGTPAEVLTAERIAQAFGADVAVLTHPDTGGPLFAPRRPAR